MEKKYLITYFYRAQNGANGFGNTIFTPTEGVDMYSEVGIRNVEKMLLTSANLKECSIQNIIPLNS